MVDLREYCGMGKLTIVVPSLQSLSLSILYPNGGLDRIVIETPSLKYFKLKDHNIESHDCLVENMPNLMEADLDLDLENIKSLIGSITSVKRLAICSEAVYGEGFVFNQLEHLKVCRCRERSSDLLVRLLKDSSNLQTLDVFEMDYHEHYIMADWKQPSTVPKCVLSSLQTLNWPVYTGRPEERDLAFYILKNALHLKTTTITSLEEDGEWKLPKFEVIKELALSSRASTTCQLVFH